MLSRDNGVHLFNSSTSKSAADLTVVITFDFEMCFDIKIKAAKTGCGFNPFEKPSSNWDSSQVGIGKTTNQP